MISSASMRVIHFVLALLVSACFLNVSAQDPRPPHNDTAPPPLRTISREERALIDAEDDAKDRIKLTLELATAHLTATENETAKQDYERAAAAAGRYWALIDDAFGFLKPMKTDSNKTRDLYKRVELTLRAHGPRLATIRRSTPIEYSVWIKDIEDLARKGRTEALNSFYGHTVVRDRPTESSRKEDKPKP
jgi:hypothetical protein